MTLLDLDLLRAFVAVVDQGGFTAAAERLGRTQTAVSMRIKRLEALTGRRLLRRNNRGVALTADGEALAVHARRMLGLNAAAVAALAASPPEGEVRLGTPADYAAAFLADVLPAFARAFPRVRVEVRCDLSAVLLDDLDRGRLDLALVTRRPGDARGTAAHREPLVWAGARGGIAHEREPLPLAVFPPLCPFREVALAALATAGREARLAYVSPSVAGLQVAVASGFAVAALARSTVLPGMRVLAAEEGFPDLPDVEIALHRRPEARAEPVSRLAAFVEAALASGPGATGGALARA